MFLQQNFLQLPQTEKPPQDVTRSQVPLGSNLFLCLLVREHTSALWVKAGEWFAGQPVFWCQEDQMSVWPSNSLGAGKVHVVSQLCGMDAMARSSSRRWMPNCSRHKKGDKGDKTDGNTKRRDGGDCTHLPHKETQTASDTCFRGSHLAWSHLQLMKPLQQARPCAWVLTSSTPAWLSRFASLLLSWTHHIHHGDTHTPP